MRYVDIFSHCFVLMFFTPSLLFQTITAAYGCARCAHQRKQRFRCLFERKLVANLLLINIL